MTDEAQGDELPLQHVPENPPETENPELKKLEEEMFKNKQETETSPLFKSTPSYLISVFPFVVRIKSTDPLVAVAAAESLAFEALSHQQQQQQQAEFDKVKEKLRAMQRTGKKISRCDREVPRVRPIAFSQSGHGRILAIDGLPCPQDIDDAPTFTEGVRLKQEVLKRLPAELTDEELKTAYVQDETANALRDYVTTRYVEAQCWHLPFNDPNPQEELAMFRFLRGSTANPAVHWCDIQAPKAAIV